MSEANLAPWEIGRLTPQETRRLLEGRRVHHEIERMLQESAQDSDGTAGGVSGKYLPRQSDDELLEDYAQRMESGEVTRAGMVN